MATSVGCFNLSFCILWNFLVALTQIFLIHVGVISFTQQLGNATCFTVFVGEDTIWEIAVPASWRALVGVAPTDDNIHGVSLHSRLPPPPPSTAPSPISPSAPLPSLFPPPPSQRAHPRLSAERTQLTQNPPSYPVTAVRPTDWEGHY